IHRYDVALHQPHPPGYPLFIALAKAVHAFGPSEAHALSLVSIIAGSLSVFALIVFFRRLADAPTWLPLVAAVVAGAAPLFWVTASRPLSDVPGLAAAVAVQAATLGATTASGLARAALFAGLAAGLRSQVLWLTVPLLLLVAWRLVLDRRRGSDRGPARSGFG